MAATESLQARDPPSHPHGKLAIYSRITLAYNTDEPTASLGGSATRDIQAFEVGGEMRDDSAGAGMGIWSRREIVRGSTSKLGS